MFIICRHGLGDTFNKLFCDPKLPFADCARKWYSSHKANKHDTQKVSSDEEDTNNSEKSASDTRMSLRRSKRTMNLCEREDDDTDALSELETLAKLGRADEALIPERWFSERALETRLHHIAHAVQNREWPAATQPGPDTRSQLLIDDRKQSQKRHIAIDVETDRAKLHALLSTPTAAHQGSGAATPGAETDVGPPPAHQRAPPPALPPASSPAVSTATASSVPVDLSAPLDLSEAQDFSVGRRSPPAAHSRSRLDDTLTRLMKRKNAVSKIIPSAL